MKSGSITDKYKAAIEAAIKAQQFTTEQAVKQLEYEKEKADKARVKANREAVMTFSRAINSTGKINQNIRSAGLAGSGWQETSQVGLTNAYQNALNTNTSDYNTAVKELEFGNQSGQTERRHRDHVGHPDLCDPARAAALSGSEGRGGRPSVGTFLCAAKSRV